MNWCVTLQYWLSRWVRKIIRTKIIENVLKLVNRKENTKYNENQSHVDDCSESLLVDMSVFCIYWFPKEKFIINGELWTEKLRTAISRRPGYFCYCFWFIISSMSGRSLYNFSLLIIHQVAATFSPRQWTILFVFHNFWSSESTKCCLCPFWQWHATRFRFNQPWTSTANVTLCLY